MVLTWLEIRLLLLDLSLTWYLSQVKSSSLNIESISESLTRMCLISLHTFVFNISRKFDIVLDFYMKINNCFLENSQQVSLNKIFLYFGSFSRKCRSNTEGMIALFNIPRKVDIVCNFFITILYLLKFAASKLIQNIFILLLVFKKIAFVVWVPTLHSFFCLKKCISFLFVFVPCIIFYL